MTIFRQTIDLQKMEGDSYPANNFQLRKEYLLWKIFFYRMTYPIKKTLDAVISDWHSKE